jgi:hypothetical protein
MNDVCGVNKIIEQIKLLNKREKFQTQTRNKNKAKEERVIGKWRKQLI